MNILILFILGIIFFFWSDIIWGLFGVSHKAFDPIYWKGAISMGIWIMLCNIFLN